MAYNSAVIPVTIAIASSKEYSTLNLGLWCHIYSIIGLTNLNQIMDTSSRQKVQTLIITMKIMSIIGILVRKLTAVQLGHSYFGRCQCPIFKYY